MLFLANSIAPVFLIIIAGMVVDRLHALPESTAMAISSFSINIAIPCLIFHIMCNAPMEQLAEWRWWIGVIGIQVLMMGIFFFLERRRGSGPAIVSGLCVSFCNAGFVGLPIIMSVYDNDPGAMAVAGLMMVATNVVVIIGQMVFIDWARQQAIKEGRALPDTGLPLGLKIWRFFRRFILGNAIFLGTFLGVLVAVFEIHLWQPLDKAIAMLGYVSPACMLFVLGLSLRSNITHALATHTISVRQQVWLCCWRLVGMPLLTLAVMLLLDIDPLWTSVTFIVSSTGAAVFIAAMAQLYNAVPGQAALTVSLTNLLSFFSLLGALTLLTWMGYMPAYFSL